MPPFSLLCFACTAKCVDPIVKAPESCGLVDHRVVNSNTSRKGIWPSFSSSMSSGFRGMPRSGASALATLVVGVLWRMCRQHSALKTLVGYSSLLLSPGVVERVHRSFWILVLPSGCHRLPIHVTFGGEVDLEKKTEWLGQVRRYQALLALLFFT